MSDGDWDLEYSKAFDIRQKIIKLCKSENIPVPYFKEHCRSWDMKLIFDNLNKEINMN